MASIKCAYVVSLSLQIMFCGFHLAIFSLIFFISLLFFYSFLSAVIWLSFSLWCLIVFPHMLCHITLRWIGAVSPAGGWQIEKNKSDIWAKLDFLSTNNKHTQKKKKKGGNKQGQHKNWWHIEQTILTTGRSLISSHPQNKRTKKRTKITNRDNIRKE